MIVSIDYWPKIFEAIRAAAAFWSFGLNILKWRANTFTGSPHMTMTIRSRSASSMPTLKLRESSVESIRGEALRREINQTNLALTICSSMATSGCDFSSGYHSSGCHITANGCDRCRAHIPCEVLPAEAGPGLRALHRRVEKFD